MLEDLPRWLIGVVTGGLLLAAGVLVVWLARLGERGALKRSVFFGIRTPLTMSSDQAWYPAQRAAAPRIKVAGWGAIIGGVAVVLLGVLPLPSAATSTVYVVLLIATAAWLIGWVLAGAASAQRAAQEAVDRAEP